MHNRISSMLDLSQNAFVRSIYPENRTFFIYRFSRLPVFDRQWALIWFERYNKSAFEHMATNFESELSYVWKLYRKKAIIKCDFFPMRIGFSKCLNNWECSKLLIKTSGQFQSKEVHWFNWNINTLRHKHSVKLLSHKLNRQTELISRFCLCATL